MKPDFKSKKVTKSYGRNKKKVDPKKKNIIFDPKNNKTIFNGKELV